MMKFKTWEGTGIESIDMGVRNHVENCYVPPFDIKAT